MRYSYEYKLKCIEMYRQGKWPETPNGIMAHNFRIMIGRWARMEKCQGSEVLRHKNFNKLWTPEEKLELISQVLAVKSNQEVAFSAEINSGMLYKPGHCRNGRRMCHSLVLHGGNVIFLQF